MYGNKIYNYMKLLRIKHYFKNFIIFFPLVFSGNLFNFDYLKKSILGFLIFSFVCSIVYIINDIMDKDKDRLHVKKKYRPLAQGCVSVGNAVVLIIILVLLIILAMLCLNINIYGFVLLFLYLFINFCYSFGLKNVALIDVVILAIGFILRVLFGASIINVFVSNWLSLTVMAMSFYLALGKRRGEIVRTKNNTREVLKYYSKDFLDKNMYMCLSLAIVFYSLWTIGSNLVWTVLIVIVICMRYSMIIENDSDGDPIEVLFNDKVLLFLIFCYVIVIIFLLYF